MNECMYVCLGQGKGRNEGREEWANIFQTSFKNQLTDIHKHTIEVNFFLRVVSGCLVP